MASREPLNPVDLENHVRGLVDQISGGVRIVSDRYAARVTAEHRYDLAFAKAYLAASGPQAEKKYRAELETVDERRERDLKEVEWSHAQRQLKHLEAALSAYQTLSKSVQQMYGAAGR